MTDDRIRLRKIRAYGYHGVYSEERSLGQIFEADIELRVDLNRPAQSDDPSDAVDYTEVYHLVKRLLSGPKHRLLESIAGRIADTILQTFPVISVLVSLRKSNLRLSGRPVFIEVEMKRERHEGGKQT